MPLQKISSKTLDDHGDTFEKYYGPYSSDPNGDNFIDPKNEECCLIGSNCNVLNENGDALYCSSFRPGVDCILDDEESCANIPECPSDMDDVYSSFILNPI